MVSHGAFIFHIYIPWGKTLSLVPKSRLSVKVKVKYQKIATVGHQCFTNAAFFYHQNIGKQPVDWEKYGAKHW